MTINDPELLDELIEERKSIKMYMEKLKADLDAIENRLRLLGRGNFWSANGVMISIKPPNRKFDLDLALKIVGEDVAQLAKIETYDPKVLKEHMSPFQLDIAMVAGDGKDRVVIDNA